MLWLIYSITRRGNIVLMFVSLRALPFGSSLSVSISVYTCIFLLLAHGYRDLNLVVKKFVLKLNSQYRKYTSPHRLSCSIFMSNFSILEVPLQLLAKGMELDLGRSDHIARSFSVSWKLYCR